jgi:hypothetical protein
MEVLLACNANSRGAPVGHLVAQAGQENNELGWIIWANLIFSILTVLLLNPPVLRVIDASIIDYDGFMFLSFKLSSTVRNLANTK